MRKYFILTILILPFAMLAQTRDKRSAPYTVRVNIGIPKSISSQMFRTAFNGIYESNVSVNARIFTNFFVGFGYQNTNFQNNKKVFVYYQAPAQGASLSYNTRMMVHGGFIKLGYDKYFEKGYFTYALNAGYTYAKYNNVVTDSAAANRPFIAKSYNAPYLQPELSVSFMADRSLTFSVMLSYTTMFYNFDPKAPRFNAIEQVRNASNKYVMTWINLGFGVTVLLGKR